MTPSAKPGARVLVIAASLAVIILGGTPNPAAACIGGIDVYWAISHTTGDILIGRATAVRTLADHSIVLDIDVPRVIRGQPRESVRVRGAMGAVCDQSADVGRTVLVLNRLRGMDPPVNVPLFYILGGPGGYPRGRIDAALARLPDTSTSLAGSSTEAGSVPAAAFLCVIAGLLGAVAIGRRLAEGRPHVWPETPDPR